MIFDLDLVKSHLRMESDYIEEDAYLGVLCIAAEENFNTFANRTLVAAGTDMESAPENAIELNESIQLGGLVLIGWLYENREGGGGKLPVPTRLLWNPYRWLAV